LHVEAGLPGFRQRARTAIAGLLLDATRVAGAAGHARQPVEPALVEGGARGEQAGPGLADVVVVRQRRLDPATEAIVLKDAPPRGRHGGFRRELRGLRTGQNDGGRRRSDVLWPD